MTWRTSSDQRTFRHRWTATIPVTALLASLLTVAQVPQEAAADTPGGLASMPSVPVVPAGGMEAPPTDDSSADALGPGQQPGSEVSDGGGRPTATPLSPSATWDVSKQTGDFTWSYPLRVPPAPGGLQPDLALSYASSAVDGRTSATNNQASWVGTAGAWGRASSSGRTAAAWRTRKVAVLPRRASTTSGTCAGVATTPPRCSAAVVV